MYYEINPMKCPPQAINVANVTKEPSETLIILEMNSKILLLKFISGKNHYTARL
jgi:hypothetical protein